MKECTGLPVCWGKMVKDTRMGTVQDIAAHVAECLGTFTPPLRCVYTMSTLHAPVSHCSSCTLLQASSLLRKHCTLLQGQRDGEMSLLPCASPTGLCFPAPQLSSPGAEVPPGAMHAVLQGGCAPPSAEES